MTPVFCCGFECGVDTGEAAHWKLVTGITFDTTIKRSGARALRINITSSTASATNTNISGTTIVIRTYIYFTTLPTTDCGLALVDTTGNLQYGAVFKSSDSKIYAGDASSAGSILFGASGVSVATENWYRIDFKVDVHTNPHTVHVSVDGIDCGQYTKSVAAGVFDRYRLSVTATSCTADLYYDDFISSTTIADYPIGRGYVNHFIPTSDGTHNVAGTADFQRTLTGTDILNATTTAFQLVDDVPLESGASVDWINMILPPNATDYVECIFGPASGVLTPAVAPRAVEVIAGIHQAGTGTGNMEIRLNDNGTTNAMYSATTVAGVTAVNYKRKHYAANIANGGAWTVTSGAGNFNNLRVRFGSPAAVDANPDQYFDCIMIEAEFAEPKQKITNVNQSVKRANSF